MLCLSCTGCLLFTPSFCWILIDFQGQIMGNDARKQIPNQTQNDRIKTIQCPQNSFKNQQEYLLLKRITLAYHLYLSCIIMTNTLKIWICLSASWNLRNCFIFHWYWYCSLDLDHLSVFLYSVQYFNFLNAWSIHMEINLVLGLLN